MSGTANASRQPETSRGAAFWRGVSCGVVAVLALLFLISLFKNISYPLLWADESITAMFGRRVAQYGYPKVRDGKNVLYDLRHPDAKLGIDEGSDAFIGGATWGAYYVAAVAALAAETSDDLFTKTAIVRFPFAALGLAGVTILAILGAQFFRPGLPRSGFLGLFLLFELLSISLVLHLREARYYPVTVFLTAIVTYLYTRYRILGTMGHPRYSVLLALSLLLLFLTFSPACFIFSVAIVSYEAISAIGSLVSGRQSGAAVPASTGPRSARDSIVHLLKNSFPVLLSLAVVIPLTSYFQTFHIAEEMAKFNRSLFGTSKWAMYRENLRVIWVYFTRLDFIYLAVAMKVCLLAAFLWRVPASVPDSVRRRLSFSNFLTVVFAVYVVAIAKIPNYPYTRYFIPLQPILALCILFDLTLVHDLVVLKKPGGITWIRALLLSLLALFMSLNVSTNIGDLRGHVHELLHQYKGPLDYVIPFIRDQYGSTENLVIATNYEETSFMYYLGSRVVIGYVGNNLEEDLTVVPDIVVYRKGWRNHNPKIFTDIIERNEYTRRSFPVYDDKVNNIPELNIFEFRHRFRTSYTPNELHRIAVYFRR